MNSNYNLCPKQRRVQQLVTQFNADEQLWRSLEGKRHRRRKLQLMFAKLRRQLDLLEFASARLPQDCVGFWQTLYGRERKRAESSESIDHCS